MENIERMGFLKTFLLRGGSSFTKIGGFQEY